MNVGLLSYNLTSNHSGQTRFLVNIAKGLKESGHNPIIYCLNIDEKVSANLQRHSIEYYSLQMKPDILSGLKYMTYSQDLGKKLSAIVTEHDLCDVYVVLADEAIPVVRFLSRHKTAYISNGDLSLMLLNPEFKRYNRIATTVLEKGFVKQIRQHAKLVTKFDKVMANSHFTSNLMSFLYGVPINKVVYPPIDLSVFRKLDLPEPEHKYALALVRNEVDPLFPVVSLLSKRINMKVIGGGRVENAENMGFVTEENLIALYNQALFTISPSVVEFFGYSIVESMGCGTPAVAYDNAGAQELIKNGTTGWLYDSKENLISGINDLFNYGYKENLRENCIVESRKYSISESSKSLMSVLKDL